MWRGRLLLVAVLCSAVGYTRGQGLTVNIDVDYSLAPPDFVGGPNDYRACSTLLLICQLEGATGTVAYNWTSTCTGCFIHSGTFQNQVVGRTTLQSVDSGILTCTATDSGGGEMGSATIEINVVGAGIFVNLGDESVPTDVLPNNGILITRPSFTAMCRSGSTITNVGQFVGLDGNTHNIGEDFGAFRVRTNGQPGTVMIQNCGGTVFTAADDGVYSCRIPDETGSDVDVNIGIYANGFSTLPTVSSLTYDPGTQTLTCTSTGSPATNVTWTRDGATLIVDGDPRAVIGTTYNVTQTVTDRSASTYENVLTLPATGDITGTYGCLVGNALGDSNTVTVEARPTSVMFNGALISNHGIVTRDDIGTDTADTLQCLTLYDSCCDNSNGFWFYPSGSEVMDSGDSSSNVFYRSRGAGAVYLHHKDGTGGDEDNGIFRCQIPDLGGNPQDVFVGIYSSNTGTPVIFEDPVFTLTSSEDPVEFTLTCTSIGGPTTTVTWTPMGNDDTQLQNAVSATYTHTLTVTGRVPGEYICSVSNDRDTATRSITVQAADPPTGLTAVQESDTTVRVSWTPPASGPTLTGYLVFYQEYDGQPTIVDVGAGETDRLLTGLSSDVAYSVSIVALAHLPSTVVGPVISRRQGVSVVLKGAVIPNNGLVTRDDIGNDGGDGGSVEDTLQCLTDDTACCMNATDSFWFYPSGIEVLGRNHPTSMDFYRTRGGIGTGGIYLHHRDGAGGMDDDGIYQCNIPGQEGSRTVYIGIYGSNTGTPVISEDPVFTLTSEDPVEFTLTCTSTGGPATTVTWTTPMSNDDTSVTLLQNAVSATYTHTLTVAGRVLGEYTCSVSNDRGGNTGSITVQEAAPPANVTFNQVNATTIRVSWTAPTSGAPPTGYRVFYLIDGDEGTEDVDDTEWLRGGFVSDRTSDITVSVMTLSDYLPSVMADVANPDAGSVELEVKTSLTSIEVTWVERPVLSNGIITMYEIQYGPTNDPSNEAIEDGPPFRLTNLSPEMSFTFRVIPFTLFDRGDTSEITADTLPPQVQNVRVISINSTSVIVTWIPISLLPSDVEDYDVSYKVYYSRVQSRKRQGPEEESVTTNGTSVVIMGLTPGAQYQFEVATLADGSGEIIEGLRSQIDGDSMPVLPPRGGGEDDGGTDSSGSIVGAIMGTFVITVLLYTVILVAVIGVVVMVKRKKTTYAVRTGQQQEITGIPMKECLAYGDVSTGERSGEEAHVYDYADAGMRVHTEQSGGEGIYDN